MLDPLDFDIKPLARKLRRARLRAGLALSFERITVQGWRLITWGILFAGLWLFQIPDLFGQSGAIAAFILFICGCGYFLYKDLRYFHFPHASEIDRRIEESSRLSHRPLSTIEDSLANPRKTESRVLWLLAKERSAKLLRLLRPVFPRSFLPSKDPYALRFAVVLFFGLGLVTAGPDWQPRLAHGLAPFVFAQSSKDSGVRLIITPPEYTGLAQLVLEGSRKQNIGIPAGSMIKATVHGGLGRPSLKVDGASLPFESAGGGNYILELAAPTGKRLVISQLFLPRASWNYILVPDTKPRIALKEKPQLTPEAAIKIPFTVQDDYGVTNITMHMGLSDPAQKTALGKPIDSTRAVLSQAKKPTDLALTYDLASNVWAGLPVKLTFTAEDHLGQKSENVSLSMILPERKFSHPVAQKLVSIRKELIASPLEHYDEVIKELEDVMVQPDAFQRDNTVLLALRSAASRLYWSGPSEETAEATVSLLWDTALRIEDGNLSLAARNLRDAQNALQNALRDPNVTDQQLAELMQNLKNAMSDYFSELQREMQKNIAEGKPMPMVSPDMLSQMMDPEALAAMMEQMQAQMMSGDRKGAEAMLAQLQNMMEMMSPSMGELPPEMQKLLDVLKDMQGLIERQRALRDQTSAQARLQENNTVTRDFGIPLPQNEDLMKQWGLKDMPPAPQMDSKTEPAPVIDTQEDQKEQEMLRLLLGQMMLKAADIMNEIPENMTGAEQRMRDSSQALWNNQPADSVPHQDAVIKLLQGAQQEMRQKLAEQIEKMTGIAMGSMRYDPLGRPYGGTNDGAGLGSTVKIPDEAEKKQAQEILRLLQKRSGEFDRPEQELDYYRRLLRQF